MMKRTKPAINYRYDEVRHTDVKLYERVVLSMFDIIHVVELHYPYTDMVYFKSLIQKMKTETASGSKVCLIFLGDTLDTPRNGKLRGDYPLLTPREVVEDFEQKILKLSEKYLKIWLLNNHDFEFMDVKDTPSDKVAVNIWRNWLPQLRSKGVFITKRVVKASLRYGKNAVFEHEHLMPITVNNRGWKYGPDYQYRIYAGNHQSFKLENIYDEYGMPCQNIGIPPCVTGIFQYAEERMNPQLCARSLMIDQTDGRIRISEDE